MFNKFFSLIHVYVLSYLLGNRNSSFGPMLKRLIKCFFFLILHLYCSFNCFSISFVVVVFFFASFVRALLKNMQSGIRQRVWHLSMTLTMPWDTQHTQDPRNGKDNYVQALLRFFYYVFTVTFIFNLVITYFFAGQKVNTPNWMKIIVNILQFDLIILLILIILDKLKVMGFRSREFFLLLRSSTIWSKCQSGQVLL